MVSSPSRCYPLQGISPNPLDRGLAKGVRESMQANTSVASAGRDGTGQSPDGTRRLVTALGSCEPAFLVCSTGALACVPEDARAAPPPPARLNPHRPSYLGQIQPAPLGLGEQPTDCGRSCV